MLTKEKYQKYVEILHEEIVPAMGCTEPVAIAYAGAKARKTLGEMPQKALIEVSGNIIKNVKAVTVPNTGGLKGIEAATAAGIVAGKADLDLEVLSQVTSEEIAAMADDTLDNAGVVGIRYGDWSGGGRYRSKTRA